MGREVEEDQFDMGGVGEERFEGLEYHLALDRREWKLAIHVSES
jgi:hypothetical protein